MEIEISEPLLIKERDFEKEFALKIPTLN